MQCVRTVGWVRWIVDGMNVIGSKPDGWWKDRHRAMVGLVERLERWAATEDGQATVVFEGPTTPPIESAVVEVGHASRATANSADDEIVRMVQADPRPNEITVVTSDSALTARVRAAGGNVQPAAGFRKEID
ncbi:RNA-binding protein [Mycolicibacterium porcinum]|nr:RNA-binding protein [Mycolicibacterium porcinum]